MIKIRVNESKTYGLEKEVIEEIAVNLVLGKTDELLDQFGAMKPLIKSAINTFLAGKKIERPEGLDDVPLIELALIQAVEDVLLNYDDKTIPVKLVEVEEDEQEQSKN